MILNLGKEKYMFISVWLYLAPHADNIKVAAMGTIAQSGVEKLNS